MMRARPVKIIRKVHKFVLCSAFEVESAINERVNRSILMTLNRLILVLFFVMSLGISASSQAKTGPRFLFKLKASTSLLVSTGSRQVVAQWLEKDYFKNTTWGLTGLNVPAPKSKKKSDEFKIFFSPTGAEGKADNQAMTLKLCQKKNLVFLELKMEKKFVKYLLKDPRYSNLSKSELKIELQKYLKDNLDDIKSYW